MPVRTTLPTLALAVSLALSACGGSGDSGRPQGRSFEIARAALVKDCVNGKPTDRKLCECVADELRRKGYDTAAKMDRANADVKAGRKPPDVLASVAVCSRRS